jgi:membrane fusion protein (multidrug efflux system)
MRIIYTIAITVIIAVLLAGCAGGEKTLPQKPKTNIKVAVLEPNGFANYTQIIGIVEPLYDVPVIAEESGTLTSIRIDKGEYVRKGQTIAVLTSEVLTAQLHQAHAAYASDSLNYAQQAQLQEVRGISEVQCSSSLTNAT